jgi:hypothetical protein
VCVGMGGVRVVALLTCTLLLLGGCVRKLGSVLEGDECCEGKSLRLSDREV